MDGIISGYLIDAVTGETVLPSQLGLTRHSVLGERYTQVDEHGRFTFDSLPPGRYNLGVYDDRYAPLYRNLTLEDGQTIEDLQISLTPGAFLKGRILDEDGLPPHRCHLTLIRMGVREARSGYISDSGDHAVAGIGHFSSPPLYPGRYFLRFAGILRKPLVSNAFESTYAAMQQRIFDFICPNAQEIKDARPFDLQTGQTLADLEVFVPRPVWRSVRGRVVGMEPESLANIHVQFARDVGMLDAFGSGGGNVEPDGSFEGFAQSGRCQISVIEMGPAGPDRRTRMTKHFTTVEVTVGDWDVVGVEIHLSE